MQDIEAFHSFIPGDYVACGITFRMADVQTLAAGVGKHIKHIIFAPGVITVVRFECFVLFPEVLPLLFNFAEFI
jgi:hypothetical protein